MPGVKHCTPHILHLNVEMFWNYLWCCLEANNIKWILKGKSGDQKKKNSNKKQKLRRSDIRHNKPLKADSVCCWWVGIDFPVRTIVFCRDFVFLAHSSTLENTVLYHTLQHRAIIERSRFSKRPTLSLLQTGFIDQGFMLLVLCVCGGGGRTWGFGNAASLDMVFGRLHLLSGRLRHLHLLLNRSLADHLGAQCTSLALWFRRECFSGDVVLWLLDDASSSAPCPLGHLNGDWYWLVL